MECQLRRTTATVHRPDRTAVVASLAGSSRLTNEMKALFNCTAFTGELNFNFNSRIRDRRFSKIECAIISLFNNNSHRIEIELGCYYLSDEYCFQNCGMKDRIWNVNSSTIG